MSAGFVTLLAEGAGAVAAFDQAMPGYGLVVRLRSGRRGWWRPWSAGPTCRAAPSGTGRRRSAAADQLDDMVRRLNGRIGLSPTPYLRMAPGRVPVAEVDPARWPAARAARAARTGRPAAARDTRPTSRPQAKERQRGG